MWQRSITLRLTLLFAAGSAAVLLAMGYVVWMALERHFEQQDLMQMSPKLQFALDLASKLQSKQDLEDLPARLQSSFAGHGEISIILASSDGKRLAGTDDKTFPPALLRTGFSATKPAKWYEGARAFRGIAAATSTKMADPRSLLLALVMDIDTHEAFMHEFQRDLWIAVGLSIVIVAALGWAAARQGLAPVRSMAALAQSITASRLQERLMPDSVPTELAELADAFNAMLARLEDSFQRLSEFSSDLAHEMRTPIASLMTQTQVSLSRLRSAEEYREVLYSNLEELDRLARMVSDMLYLAKADKGLIVPSPQAVDLHAEVLELFDFYGALVQEQRLHLELSGKATVPGDKLMLRRALSNLLSNAIRHTPQDGKVTVDIAATDERARIEVRNTGPAIPREQLPKLFERFYRVDHAHSEGTGLGLAITKAIVEAHGGSIFAASSDASTAFTIGLPASKSQ